jgi:hypothetical protein
MAATYTVAELLERVRLLGDYQNATGDYSDVGSHMSSGTLVTFMDVAYREAWEERSDADEGWALTGSSYTLSSGVPDYALPSDIHRVRSVDLYVADSGWVPLDRANRDDDSYAATTGEPRAYRVVGDFLELLPIPDGGTMRVRYCPSATRISSSLQTVPATDGFDQVVVLRTLVMAREREEKPADEFRADLAKAEQSFRRSVAGRDRATPRRLRDPRSLRRRR